MGQPCDAQRVRARVDVFLREHPPVADKDKVGNAVGFLDFGYLIDHGCAVGRIAGENFHRDGASLLGADKADDNLFLAAFFVPVVAICDRVRAVIFPLKVTACYVIQYDRAVFKMPGGELFLDLFLAGKQLVHGVVAMLVNVYFRADAANLP